MVSTDNKADGKPVVKKSFMKNMYRGVELHDLVEFKIQNVVKLLKLKQRKGIQKSLGVIYFAITIFRFNQMENSKMNFIQK